MNTLFNTIGLLGVILLLIAYFLLQRGTISSHSPLYSWLNLLGALGLAISLLWSWNLASFVIECAWIIISIYGLMRAQPKELSK